MLTELDFLVLTQWGRVGIVVRPEQACCHGRRRRAKNTCGRPAVAAGQVDGSPPFLSSEWYGGTVRNLKTMRQQSTTLGRNVYKK